MRSSPAVVVLALSLVREKIQIVCKLHYIAVFFVQCLSVSSQAAPSNGESSSSAQTAGDDGSTEAGQRNEQEPEDVIAAEQGGGGAVRERTKKLLNALVVSGCWYGTRVERRQN